MKWYTPLIFLAIAVVGFFIPNLRDVLNFPVFYLVFMYFIFFWAAQATSWNMFSGYSGYFSFGQGAFYGIGIYTSAVMVYRLDVPFLLTLPIAGVLSAILALLTGVVVFRLRQLRGELFALLTLALDLVMAAIARRTDYIDGGFGLTLGGFDYPEFLGDFSEMMFRLGLFMALLSVFAAVAIYYSRFGRGLFAIRDDENVAEGLGVPTFQYKLLIFAIASFFAGMSGGLHAAQVAYVTVEGVFNIRIPLFVILMAILGGQKHWLGPIMGAVVITTLTEAFSGGEFEAYNDIAVGLLLIIMIVFVREGLFERLRSRLVPSLVLFFGAIGAQVIFNPDVRLVTLLAVAMLLSVALLMVPVKWFDQITLRRGGGAPPPAAAQT